MKHPHLHYVYHNHPNHNNHCCRRMRLKWPPLSSPLSVIIFLIKIIIMILIKIITMILIIIIMILIIITNPTSQSLFQEDEVEVATSEFPTLCQRKTYYQVHIITIIIIIIIIITIITIITIIIIIITIMLAIVKITTIMRFQL